MYCTALFWEFVTFLTTREKDKKIKSTIKNARCNIEMTIKHVYVNEIAYFDNVYLYMTKTYLHTCTFQFLNSRISDWEIF